MRLGLFARLHPGFVAISPRMDHRFLGLFCLFPDFLPRSLRFESRFWTIFRYQPLF